VSCTRPGKHNNHWHQRVTGLETHHASP
jgi:hypothetical protein